MRLRDYKLHIDVKNLPFHLDLCRPFAAHWWVLWRPVLRIRDVFPGSWFLPIPDLGSRIPKQQQREGRKKIVVIPFYVATNLNMILVLKCWRKKFGSIFQLFTQKIVTKLSKIWVWDPGSEIRDPEKNLFRIPDPGVKKAPDPESGSGTLTKTCDFVFCSVGNSGILSEFRQGRSVDPNPEKN